MDPTKRLYMLLDISTYNSTNIVSLLPNIENAILDGAILDNIYIDSTTDIRYLPPIYNAIILKCNIEIIKLLKKYWWDSNKIIEFIFLHIPVYEDRFITYNGEADAFFNLYYHLHYNTRKKYIDDLIELLEITIIRNDKLRESFIEKLVVNKQHTKYYEF